MRRFSLYIVISSLLSACILDSQLIPVVNPETLHDGTSKVWVVNKEFKEDKELQPPRFENQKTFTFFSDGDVCKQKRLHLGGYSGFLGKFSLTYDEIEKDTSLLISFHKNSYAFYVKHFSKKKIVLQPKDEYKNMFKMELIPLDKPF